MVPLHSVTLSLCQHRYQLSLADCRSCRSDHSVLTAAAQLCCNRVQTGYMLGQAHLKIGCMIIAIGKTKVTNLVRTAWL